MKRRRETDVDMLNDALDEIVSWPGDGNARARQNENRTGDG